MASVELQIVRPTSGQIFVQLSSGGGSVEFEGQGPSEINSKRLFYRWYSSLNTDANANKHRYSLNNGALPSAETIYTHAEMPMGSQIIAFAACDQESEADIQQATIGGVTGGAKEEGNTIVGHVIHVVKANILSPRKGETISDGFELKAEAPWAWEDTSYQKYNKLRYRWEFKRPTSNQLVFDWVAPDMRFEEKSASNPPHVVFKFHPPSDLEKVEGDYILTLHVQCVEGTKVRGEATDRRTITLKLAP